MARYRTHTHDAPEPRPLTPADPPGTPPKNRIPILNQHGERKGHVGHRASEATVARFGVRNAKLTTVGGRPAWVGRDDFGARRQAAVKRLHDLRAAKGSVTKHPTKPETTARPKRGG